MPVSVPRPLDKYIARSVVGEKIWAVPHQQPCAICHLAPGAVTSRPRCGIIDAVIELFQIILRLLTDLVALTAVADAMVTGPQV